MNARSAKRAALVSAGALWTLPNTLLGLLAGLACCALGARPYRAEGVLAFKRIPRTRGALVLGCVILHGGENLDAIVPTYAARCGTAAVDECVRIGDHERAHVFQYLLCGPLFLPLYFFCGGVSVRNPFERAADAYAVGGDWRPWRRAARAKAR